MGFEVWGFEGIGVHAFIGLGFRVPLSPRNQRGYLLVPRLLLGLVQGLWAVQGGFGLWGCRAQGYRADAGFRGEGSEKKGTVIYKVPTCHVIGFNCMAAITRE